MGFQNAKPKMCAHPVQRALLEGKDPPECQAFRAKTEFPGSPQRIGIVPRSRDASIAPWVRQEHLELLERLDPVEGQAPRAVMETRAVTASPGIEGEQGPAAKEVSMIFD
uniref:Gag protein n=1 Tax=Globodera pallida TaxID=36090 RepID=A0A183CEL2_GLOPA